MILVVAGSIIVGLVLAIALVIGPASGAPEAIVTGCGLLASGVGWLALAALSIRNAACDPRASRCDDVDR